MLKQSTNCDFLTPPALQTSVQPCHKLITGPPPPSAPLQPCTATDSEAQRDDRGLMMLSDDVTLDAGQPIESGEGGGVNRGKLQSLHILTF